MFAVITTPWQRRNFKYFNQEIAHFIVEPLTYLINNSLVQGIYPSKLKIPNVIPLFKKGEPELIINYRAISLCPSISKIYEVVINNQLIYYFTLDKLLSPYQHGFTRQKSLDTALGEFINEIIEALDQSEVTYLTSAYFRYQGQSPTPSVLM